VPLPRHRVRLPRHRGRLRIRANLKPWLRDAYDVVHERWDIGGTRENIERVVAAYLYFKD
jgi:hypothetical protein